ncbi:MAG TPA: VOC family protein [Sphingomicrobium sp.]|nr:VOC family protein [Sphingomicrobium sp.]
MMTDVRTAPTPTLGQERQERKGDFIWYELMTTDSSRAKQFYEAVVGWKIGEAVAEYGGYRMIGRSDGKFAGGLLQLTSEMEQHGARPTWLAYLSVDDVDEAVSNIEAAGGKAMMPPFDIPNVGRIAMVSDPQGAPFYVMKPIPPADDPNAVSDVFSPNEEQRVGWNELQTSDVDGARRFYGRQFGWGSEEFMSMGEMGDYRFWDHRGERIGALFDPKNGQPPHWRFYFRVASVEAARSAVEDHGGMIHMGPHEVPTGDWVIIGSDPQGAEFALVGAK